jgi:hypothetical protein
MQTSDAIQTVTHVADVNRYPSPGLNKQEDNTKGGGRGDWTEGVSRH